jgi:hypothetical protein
LGNSQPDKTIIKPLALTIGPNHDASRSETSQQCGLHTFGGAVLHGPDGSDDWIANQQMSNTSKLVMYTLYFANLPQYLVLCPCFRSEKWIWCWIQEMSCCLAGMRRSHAKNHDGYPEAWLEVTEELSSEMMRRFTKMMSEATKNQNHRHFMTFCWVYPVGVNCIQQKSPTYIPKSLKICWICS